LQFAISIILARVLSPREFGLIGMILVFTAFASSLSDMRLGAALIQKRAVSDRHLNSVFWLNVGVGSSLTLLFCLTAPLVANFYHEPLLRLLTIAVAINFVLNSLTVVHTALLDKSLSFRARFWIEIVATFFSGIVALTLAFNGAGVWSLVGQSLTAAVIRIALMWRSHQWRPGTSFDLSALKDLMHFGGPLFGSSIVAYWGRNFDKLVIGRLIGSSALGIYNLADRLMRLPLTNVTDVTTAVMFPALSLMQDDVESVRRVYLRATGMIALLTFPMMIGLSVAAEPAILVVYGDQWREAIGIVQLLCFAGMAQSVYNTATWIFLSRGRTDTFFRLIVYTTLVRVAGVFVGVHWGITGVAWAYVLGGYVLLWYPTWSAVGRLLHLRVGELLKNVAGPLGCAAAMGVLVWSVDWWLLAGQAAWIRLILQTVMGTFVYCFFIRRFRLKAWDETRSLILEIGGRRRRFIRWLLQDNDRAGS